MDAPRTNEVIDVKADDDTWICQLDESLEDHDAWINRLTKRVEETTCQGQKYTIYRFLQWLRIIDPTAYEPRILSLGPYHYGKPQFRTTNELKWIYLKKILRRNPRIRLGDYINIVRAMEAQTREVYSEAPNMDSKYWVEMMLLDSCFVLEMLIMQSLLQESDDESLDPTPSNSGVLSHMMSDMLEESDDDPTPSNSGVMSDMLEESDDELLDPKVLPHMMPDMLLLENQLPFFLLEKLLNYVCNQNDCSLPLIVLKVFVNVMPGKLRLSFYKKKIHHILHLLYICSLPPHPARGGDRSYGLRNRKRSSFSPLPRKLMPSAKTLHEAGVVFRNKTKNEKSFMDITFRRGILEIPQLQILEQSNLVFRNFIAFEQCKNQHSTYWGAYAYMMDCIIDTPADFSLLQQKGIIVSTLDNDDETARFFNRLRTNATFDNNNYLSDVFNKVERHCNKRVNKWKASFKHNYLTNPWVIASVIAAIFLFMLTITQTILALFSYFWPRSP